MYVDVLVNAATNESIFIHTCFDLSERSIMLNGAGQRLVRSAKVSLRSDAPEEDVGAAPWAEDTLLSSTYGIIFII